MGKFDKFLKKLLDIELVITLQELKYSLGNLEYVENITGKALVFQNAHVHE
jgi:hypothetical protein